MDQLPKVCMFQMRIVTLLLLGASTWKMPVPGNQNTCKPITQEISLEIIIIILLWEVLLLNHLLEALLTYHFITLHPRWRHRCVIYNVLFSKFYNILLYAKFFILTLKKKSYSNSSIFMFIMFFILLLSIWKSPPVRICYFITLCSGIYLFLIMVVRYKLLLHLSFMFLASAYTQPLLYWTSRIYIVAFLRAASQ